jgi:hypothetical protein
MPTVHSRSVRDNITYALLAIVVLCFAWEVFAFAADKRATFSESLRRLNYQSGGLIVWMLIALILHATIPWPSSWHNREAYIAQWGSSPDIG